MNHHSCVRGVLHLPLGLAFLATSFVRGEGTPNADAQQSAYRSSIAQESVRKEADKIQGELARLIAESKLNGLDNASLGTLVTATAHLSSLSQDDMQKVINALQRASIAAEDQKRQASLVTAYTGQKEVVVQLKNLAAALTAEQAGNVLVIKVQALIARQTTNIRQTSTLKAGGHALAQLDAKEKPVYDVASPEQTSIGGEIDVLATLLGTAGADTSPNSSATMAKAMLDALNGGMLKETALAATTFTKAGPFPDAVTKQTAVRDGLIAILHAAQSKEDAVAQLEQAKSQLDQVAADQKDLAAAAKQPNADKQALAERQAKVQDRAEVAKDLLKPLNSPAANQVDTAEKAMQKCTDAMADPKQPDATPPQDEAAKNLAAAQKMLDKQIADAQEKENQSPTDQVADIQKVQDEIKQAQTAATPQDAAKDLQQAQQDALPQSPDAASDLADAADKMQQSQPNTDAANKDLAAANAALEKQKDALNQAAKDYRALADASKQLDEAKELATDADQKLKQDAPGNLTDPARKLTDAQAKVDQVGQAPPQNLPGDAKQALQQAGDALKEASNQAVQAKRGEAHAQTQKGLEAIAQAQGSLSQAMAQITQQSRQQMGQAKQQQGQQQMAQIGGTGVFKGPQQLLKGQGAEAARGTALVVGGLSPKDRDAISQYQAEKTPVEYAPLVQQYLKNLADGSDAH